MRPREESDGAEILLWMARNPWLRAHLPRLRFVRRAVRSFMPGEDLGSATAAAAACRDDGVKAAFTRLGENLTDLAEAGAVADHYVEVLDEIERLGLDGEISIKLTQLGYDLDVETAYGHFDRIARRAAEVGTWAWVDMEGSAYVEGTIAFYERARAAHDNVGLCLQAYLHRTPADVQRLLPIRPGIRLVKGAYDEPSDDRLPLPGRRRRRLPGDRNDLRTGGPRWDGPVHGRHPRRWADRADRPVRRVRSGSSRPRSRSRCSTGSGPTSSARSPAGGSTSAASSPTASTGTRGTCVAWPSGRPTSSFALRQILPW